MYARERGRERQRDRERHTERQRDRERHRETHTERETERERRGEGERVRGGALTVCKGCEDSITPKDALAPLSDVCSTVPVGTSVTMPADAYEHYAGHLHG